MSISQNSQHGVSRREAIKVMTFGGIAIAAALGSPLFTVPAFGADDGGGAGGGEGGGGEGGGPSPYTLGEGAAWRWFDRGGFYVSDANHEAAVQGWEDKSAKWFWENQVEVWMGYVAGKSWGTRLPIQGGPDSSNHYMKDTALKKYNAAAADALQAAKDVSGQDAARVVGVGWYYQIVDRDGGVWRLLYNGTNEGRARLLTFDALLQKKAVPSAAKWSPDLPTESIPSAHAAAVEAIKGSGWNKARRISGETGAVVNGGGVGNSYASLSAEAGWDLPVDVPGYVGMSWREYIWQQGHDTLKKDDYVVVVVAAADGWPKRSGFLQVGKGLDI